MGGRGVSGPEKEAGTGQWGARSAMGGSGLLRGSRFGKRQPERVGICRGLGFTLNVVAKPSALCES